ncbi:unnamed protein product [Paramecium sonneborni]|uniref:Transmembrane protein n=1 Tax=Paramecium sonneborni TaxID=65129 RepID=A0A8S1QQM6_9CILI|nr:unnamed protein product [Paramecium sonneborni]
MKEMVETYLDYPVIRAVITFSTYFNYSQRQATQVASLIYIIENRIFQYQIQVKVSLMLVYQQLMMMRYMKQNKYLVIIIQVEKILILFWQNSVLQNFIRKNDKIQSQIQRLLEDQELNVKELKEYYLQFLLLNYQSQIKELCLDQFLKFIPPSVLIFVIQDDLPSNTFSFDSLTFHIFSRIIKRIFQQKRTQQIYQSRQSSCVWRCNRSDSFNREGLRMLIVIIRQRSVLYIFLIMKEDNQLIQYNKLIIGLILIKMKKQKFTKNESINSIILYKMPKLKLNLNVKIEQRK